MTETTNNFFNNIMKDFDRNMEDIDQLTNYIKIEILKNDKNAKQIREQRSTKKTVNNSDNHTEENIRYLFQSDKASDQKKDLIDHNAEENIKYLFQDDKSFNIFKKLCKYELLQVFKETYNLSKKDVKIINKIATESILSKKELNHISNFVKNFTEKEIELLEKIVKKYAKEFELLKVEQEFDIFEKAQLNQVNGDKNFLKSMASWIKEAFTRVIEKLKSGKYLVEFEGIKKQEGNSKFDVNNEVISESQSLEDLTDFGFAKAETDLHHVEINKAADEHSKKV